MQHLSTLLDWIRYAASRLACADIAYGHGTDAPLDEAAALVLGLLNLPYDLSPAYFPARLTADEIVALQTALDRRINDRIPVPYLTHRTLYGGYEFYVDERVLIPRSPIVELIERGLGPWWQGDAPETILDLCCGSGCLGILAQLQQPQAEVVLADLDPDALDVARINLARFRMADSVAICQGDGLAAVSGQFDWIICNPPYVEAAEMDDIAAEFQGRLKVVKINIDENEATPAKFGVRGIPTLMVFKNGKNVATKVGALAKGQLTAFVEASIA